MLIPENLKQARKNKNLSQRQLGKLVGVSGTMIGFYENGTRDPSTKILERIAQQLDVNINYLDAPEDPVACLEDKIKFDTIIKLVALLEQSENEQKYLREYTQLGLTMKEMFDAIEQYKQLNHAKTPTNNADNLLDKNTLLERIVIYAEFCHMHYQNMTAIQPNELRDLKQRFYDWQNELQKFNALLTRYCSMNPTGRKIAANTMLALASTPEYRKEEVET